MLRALRLMPARSRVESFTTTELALTVRARDGVLPRIVYDGELHRPMPSRGASFELRMRVVPDGLLVYSGGPDRPE